MTTRADRSATQRAYVEGARCAASALHRQDADVDFYDAQLDVGAMDDASMRGVPPLGYSSTVLLTRARAPIITPALQ